MGHIGARIDQLKPQKIFLLALILKSECTSQNHLALIYRLSALLSIMFLLKTSLANLLAAESFACPYQRIVECSVDLPVTGTTAVRRFAAPDI
jgi:hypothetical protein